MQRFRELAPGVLVATEKELTTTSTAVAHPGGGSLIIDPALPDAFGELQLLDIPGRWGRMDAFGRARHLT